MLRFQTAGESHGRALVAWISGLPAGIQVDISFINRELKRRQEGYGRGGRMKIESDQVEILSGVRRSKTTGAPIALLIANRDWENWKESLPVEEQENTAQKYKSLTSPRPGHADLAGCLKYNLHEARLVLERASARESAARVAAGAMAKLLLAQFGIEVLSHVIAVGDVYARNSAIWEQIQEICAKDDTLLRCVDGEAELRMKAAVDEILRTGDSLGGIFEVVAHNVPAGLGTHANWDERLDGLLAQAVMSLQAVKAVEIGTGIANAVALGSKVHDQIDYDKGAQQFTRPANHAGGLEGGISNGEDIVVRGYLKPISTLRRPLQSVDLETKEPVKAAYERSDVCVVPAAGVAAEAMVALVLARCFLEKFGCDSLEETRRNFEGYLAQIRAF
ncbi:MAG: chorismate synthase [Acidobacteria bacterium RIFCSPLOWO2_12_FULL_59_11]|nr:MAG: chorismate synthase [Acidobacteria bacterium RIFCSPLOWO2_12_FULL_59_11]